MIEQGENDFVARAEVAADGAAHGVGQRRHVEAKDDFVGIAMKEVGHGCTSGGDGVIGAATGEEGATGIGVGVLQVVADGIDDALRNLRAARTVEVGGGLAVHFFGEGRELLANSRNVEFGCNFILRSRHSVLRGFLSLSQNIGHPRAARTKSANMPYAVA